jgi:hypothetical protein
MNLDLLTQGSHHERTQTFHMRQNHNGHIGKLAFKNRLNNILRLLGDKWLDQCQVRVKKLLCDTIRQKIPAECVQVFC